MNDSTLLLKTTYRGYSITLREHDAVIGNEMEYWALIEKDGNSFGCAVSMYCADTALEKAKRDINNYERAFNTSGKPS